MNHATYSATEVQSAFLTLRSLDRTALHVPHPRVSAEDVRSLAQHLHHLAGPEAPTTARYSWQDLLMASPGHAADCTLLDLPRNSPTFDQPTRLLLDERPNIGGVLLWNKTLDAESGTLIMLTGQVKSQEQQVVRNATWMASTGAMYSARRTGWKGYKLHPDVVTVIDGEEHLLWLLPNAYNVSTRQ